MSADKLDEIEERLIGELMKGNYQVNGGMSWQRHIRAALDEARREDRAEMKAEHAKLLACERHVAGLQTELQEAHGLKQMARDEATKLRRDLDAKDHRHAEDRAEIERLKAALHQSREVEGGAQTAVLDQRSEIERLRGALSQRLGIRCSTCGMKVLGLPTPGYPHDADCAETRAEAAEGALVAVHAEMLKLQAKLAEAQTPCKCDHSDRRLCCADAEGMLCVCELAAERAKVAKLVEAAGLVLEDWHSQREDTDQAARNRDDLRDAIRAAAKASEEKKP